MCSKSGNFQKSVVVPRQYDVLASKLHCQDLSLDSVCFTILCNCMQPFATFPMPCTVFEFFPWHGDLSSMRQPTVLLKEWSWIFSEILRFGQFYFMSWELHAGMFDVQVHVLADQALTLQFSTNNPRRHCSALQIFRLFSDCMCKSPLPLTARPAVNVQDLWQSFLACETLSDPQAANNCN